RPPGGPSCSVTHEPERDACDRGERRRPGRERRRRAAPLRAILLAQAAWHRARARDRQAHDRGARGTYRGATTRSRRPHDQNRASDRTAPAGGRTRVSGDGAIAAGAAYLVPTLLWAILAHDAWHFRLHHRPRAPLYRLLPFVTTAVTMLYVCFLLSALLLPHE